MIRSLLLSLLMLVVGQSTVEASYFSQVTANPNLVAYWRLGESAGPTAVDVKGTASGTYLNFAGAAYSQPSALAGDANTSVRFNGSNTYVDAGNPAVLNGNWAGLTIAAWIRPDNVDSNFKLIAGKWANVATDDHFGLFQGNDKILIAVGDGSAGENGLFGNGNVPLVPGQYSFVVGTWDAGTRAYRLYVNGQPDSATGTQSGNGINTHSTKSMTIGAENVPGSERFFPGLIDEPAIFSRALSPAEVLGLYNAGITVPEPGALWLLVVGLAVLLPLGFRAKAGRPASCLER